MSLTEKHRNSPFVDAETLIATPNGNRLFVDVRLGDPDVELEKFRDGHIYGAVHAQIRDVFAAQPTAHSGNLPLRRLEDLRVTLNAWGVDAQTEIVLYGPTLALAARGWWVLRWAGLEHVSVLEGGLRAWTAAGGPVARGDAPPRRAGTARLLSLSPGNLADIDLHAVNRRSDAVVLLDARDEAAYQAGHIPGALNAPASDLWTPSGGLRPERVIASQYAKAGVLPDHEVIVYCGGGVLSALSWMTLAEAGVSVRLYVGSWSEWHKLRDKRQVRAKTGGEA
ncbi:sulfurtransferase [Paraburkholderia sp. D1E]|uniref:sulfurtransferase n=1 Tax=Paraburkholderia sp. D1E TaxID=3461398 RepID=UPI004045443E